MFIRTDATKCATEDTWFFDRLAGNVKKSVVIFTISRRSYYMFQCKTALRREEIVVASHTPILAALRMGLLKGGLSEAGTIAGVLP
ncbi:MAG: hypothetical protein CW341_10895 [Bacteroidetes bacterium]|nr:hypothetical protein [Bacteroidota bacterium]